VAEITQFVTDFCRSYSWKKLFFLCAIALVIRALAFLVFIQFNERYKQPDTLDYHNCAIGLYKGIGMRRIDSGHPIFWRTPGYPLLISWFYSLYGMSSYQFEHNKDAIFALLWIQILLCSLTPLLVFFLALFLVNSIPFAWIVSWITAIHLGFVLASCYVLTDAIALLFFLLFLIFFYKGLRLIGEKYKTYKPVWHFIIAALSLAGFTWFKPFGQLISCIAILILLLNQISWKEKLRQTSIFVCVFWICLSPWLIRNHRLTGKWFFWPGSGTYFLCFSVPKLMRRLTGESFAECHKRVLKDAQQQIIQEYIKCKRETPELYVSQELISQQLVWPWIKKYPLWVLIDGFFEICKSIFDLYASQLVRFAQASHTWDPLEEFLSEKLQDCLYAQEMSIGMRLLCWLELLFALLKWFGIFFGLWLFLLRPLIKSFVVSDFIYTMFFLWLKTGLLIGAVLCMTGGFGYARLRMPVDPLLYILSLTTWYWLFYIRQKNVQSFITDKK